LSERRVSPKSIPNRIRKKIRKIILKSIDRSESGKK
jgi:hypothetical protein